MTTKELNFIQSIIKSTLLLNSFHFVPPYNDFHKIDYSLRKNLFDDYDYSTWIRKMTDWSSIPSIYSFVDDFRSHYIIIELPNTKQEFLVIGPYILEPTTSSMIQEIISHNKLNMSMEYVLKDYVDMLPVMDSGILHSTMTTIGEFIFGSKDKFSLTFDTDLKEHSELLYNLNPNPDLSFQMTLLENRYKTENELMDAISKGDRETAFHLIPHINSFKIEPKLKDSTRNLRNNAIISNTLFRKAAERSFVHPYYLDALSRKFSLKIEMLVTEKEFQSLYLEMIRKYCLSIKNHSLQEYSPLIRKTIDYITINLSNPLTLSIIANDFSINASYLSSCFKKETNMTITQYINRQRIQTAITLLNTTDMNIQTISYHVGIHDVNYFTRLFKKFVGVTPTKYRTTIKNS